MAHPQKKSATDSHNAKLRRMTRDYGSAGGPSMNKLAPMDRLKEEGPEQPVGFGADYDAASARSDQPARRSVAANPLATYKNGGKVRERALGGRLDNKPAAGSKKGATNVNVIIAPQGGAQPGAGMAPPPPPGPPIPPSAAPAPPPSPLAGMGAAMPPGGAPPGMMPRAKGGRVTGYDAGAGSGEGRLEKIKNYGRKTANDNPQVV